MLDMSASANLALTHLVSLADKVDDNKVTPGVLGFLVFAALAVGVWFLMKSMNRHMGRIDFEEAPDPTAKTKTAEAAEAAGEGAASKKAPAQRK
jgi:hypothetical protein